MHRFATIFFPFAGLLFASSNAQQDPCVGYEKLTEIRRSVLSEADPGEPNICDRDRIVDGRWYRFEVLHPSRMPEHCVEPLKCGTDRPIYMNGVHPTENAPGPKAVEVCSRRGNDCCGGWRSTIQVKFCKAVSKDGEDFYVYQLKPVPECDMAYCAGNALVCDQGTVYNPNSKSCTEPFPVMTAPPDFEGPVIERKTMKAGGKQYDDFYFACNIKLKPDPDAEMKRRIIEVIFTFDGLESPLVPPKTTDGTNTRIRLWSKELKGQLVGKTVGCMTRSYWESLKKENSHFLKSSGGYFVGLRYSLTNEPGSFTNEPIVITEGLAPATLYFESTVPISCPETDYQVSCTATVRVADIPDSIRIGVGKCAMVFNGQITGSKTSTQSVQALTTPGTHHRTAYISFKTIDADPNFFWNGYQPPNILVQVLDSSASFWCSSTGDPHFVTFDKKAFNNYLEGDFILAKSTERNFQVHVRQHKCGPVTCNCAVAVREGNNVLGINACQKPDYAPLPIRYSTDQNIVGASITNNGHIYMITMPSGAYVQVNSFWTAGYGRHLGVYVYVNSEDYYKTSGMCGSLNGNSRDDVLPADSYRLSDESSLLNAHIYPIKCADKVDPLSNICSCEKNPCKPSNVNGYKTTQVSTGKFDRNCYKWNTKTAGTKNGMGNEILPKPPVERKRREARENSTIDDDEPYEMLITEEDFPLEKFDENFGKNVNPTWPTASGITEAEANRRCKSRLETSPVFNVCKEQLTKEDIDGIISNCVTDLQILDNTEMAVGYIVDSLQAQCVTVLENKIVTNQTNETIVEPPSTLELLLLDITSKICPNQCNGNGTCLNGSCVCNSGFAGDDCSVNTRNPPQLSSIRTGLICDSRIKGCSVTSIIAKNFYRSVNLVCKVSLTNSSREFKYSASVISTQEVFCRLPLVHRASNKTHPTKRETEEALVPAPYYHWEISLSNDGGNAYSNSLRLAVFDSKCQRCSTDGNCVRKNNSCEIDGRCYAAYEISDHDKDLGCIPPKSQTKWTSCSSIGGCSSAAFLIMNSYLISVTLVFIVVFAKLL